jgi:hypothetical protein
LVVDDPDLAAGLKLLRGEWAERSGGELEVRQATLSELLAASTLTEDVVIYPSRQVGALVERGWLRPVRKSVLESADLDLQSLYPMVRDGVLRYGNQVYALSLGEPPLLLATSLPAVLEVQTWQAVTIDRGGARVAYPRALELLARAVAATEPHRRGELCFEPQSMEPRLTSPPFVRALQQMRRQSGDPTAFLTLPQAAGSARVALLPRAAAIYHSTRDSWQAGLAELPVTLLAGTGRSMSVTRATRNVASAFKVLAWLASETTSTQLSPRSAATVWCRPSQTQHARQWLEGAQQKNEEIIAVVSQQLTAEHYFLLPRIPGIEAYLQSLEDALADTLSKVLESPPGAPKSEGGLAESTLRKVSASWQTLTDRLGRDRQRVAYRRHLGLDDSDE